MDTLGWLVRNGAAESQLIFNLFHLLLAGLTLLILLYQLRPVEEAGDISDRLLLVAFALIAVRFAVLTLYFGARFFYGTSLQAAAVEHFTHALLCCGLLVLAAAFQCYGGRQRPLLRWGLLCSGGVFVLAVVDVMLASRPPISSARSHSVAMLMCDLVALAAAAVSVSALMRSGLPNRRTYLIALGLLSLGLGLHLASTLLPLRTQVFLWEAEQVVISVSLFGFAWVMGERSPKLLDRIFVRLNLTFIVLASLIMMVTAGMEKYQYMSLAEHRSTQFAEFLRNELNHYRGQGEDLGHILRHAAVSDRVVAEFANLPELRRLNVYLDSQQVSFGYTSNWSVKQEILPAATLPSAAEVADPANSFQMLVLPLDLRPGTRNRIEFLGTMDYINRYIGKYIVFIYAVFTIVVVLATGIIGIIVAEADRQLQRKYAELEETHKRLAEAAKLASVGELAGGMAHEINTPITSILSLASHMAGEHSASGMTPRQRSSLQLIASQAERVSRIVGGLLNFSRQSQLHLSDVHIAEVLETAVTLIQYRLDDRGIALRRNITDGLCVRGDAGALTEVVLNLLTNAIDAMPAGGALTLSAHADTNGGVRLEVSDAGVGILPQELARIFDPFYTTKEPGRGTGLGLSVSHGIVKRHGGEIWAESEPGVGSTFVVTLPAEAKV